MSRTLTRLLALIFAFSLIGAACGSDDDSTGAGAEAEGDTVETTATDDSGGSDDSAGDEGSGDDAAATTDVDLAGAELQLWGWASSETEDAQLTSLIESFNSATGANASFEPQPEFDAALQAALVAGDPPDAFYVDSARLPDLADAGALQPVPDGAISDPDDIYPALRDIFTIDGTWYCPPKDFSTLGLIYSPSTLEAAGLAVPTTWEELATAAEALTTDDQVGLSFGAEYARAGAFLFQAGSGVLSEDGTEVIIDNGGGLEALQYLADLFAGGSAATPQDIDTGWGGEAFATGAAAMTIEGNWIVPFLHDQYPDIDFAVAELPAGPAGPGTFAFTVCYGVPAASDNAEQGWAMVEFLTDSEGAAAWTAGFQVMPARASARDGWLAANPELEAFVAAADYASPYQFPAGVGDIQGVFNDGFQRMIAGEITPEELVQQVVDAGADLL